MRRRRLDMTRRPATCLLYKKITLQYLECGQNSKEALTVDGAFDGNFIGPYSGSPSQLEWFHLH